MDSFPYIHPDLLILLLELTMGGEEFPKKKIARLNSVFFLFGPSTPLSLSPLSFYLTLIHPLGTNVIIHCCVSGGS